MIAEIRNTWLRRTALVAIVPVAVLYLVVALAVDLVVAAANSVRDLMPDVREIARDICTVWRGPSA